MDIGPADVRIDLKVGEYLSKSPTPAEFDCLKTFFRTIRRTAQTVTARQAGLQQVIVHCGHDLLITQQGNTIFVTDIFRSCVPP